ncbi:hypothetical protein EPUS_08495 [Endocarpon pusillum Z07020]|uniref:MULE transposase domain-containing protein n=1 Tax=Endocarpon pusillum (strain Z07020 / HMAS-L-300199) TaxID=1263415 RepID=U1G689_ENDPU|nr:uncharacterized protein EPUS_08495 [Endocarpon pusillum Z07020]ERF72882.1 hypothetical protein EPUS_08495 [Endocarpon pusillum Z07020]
MLLAKNADVNAQGGEYGNALQAASLRGHEKVVEILLAKNADVNAHEKSGNALQAASWRGHEKVVEINALQAASSEGHEKVVEMLLANNADVNAQGGEYGNALQAASLRGHEKVVEIWLAKNADVNAHEKSGNALQAASLPRHEKVVEIWLAKNADVNAHEKSGNALQAASWRGDEKVVEILLANNADVNAQGGFYGNALYAASLRGHEKVVEMLLNKVADVNAQGGEYGNALLECVGSGPFAAVHSAKVHSAFESWRLEKHTERDEEDRVTTRRKQESTNINARSCPYYICLTYKQVGKRGSGVFGFILSIRDNTHTHLMAVNALRYKKHVKTLPGYLPAMELGKSLRTANISYSVALQVLEQVGFPLDRNSYYNIRSRVASAEQNEFAALVVALEEAGFIFECRIEEEFDSESGITISRQLQQIWFAHPQQIRYAQRFIADFALFINGTFQTNALNLVLIITASITNCNSTFVSSLSFARSKAKLSFDFILKSLKKHVFCPPIPVPRIIISDQAAGLKASMPVSLPGTILQFCDWHAVQTVLKRLADKGYSKEIRKEMKSLLWSFVKSNTQLELEAIRTAIHSKLRPDKIQYLNKYWGPKESQFLRIHTRKHPNLGAHSNQRSESLHPGTKDILNKQLNMEEATRRLGVTVKSKLRQLSEQEAQNGSLGLQVLEAREDLTGYARTRYDRAATNAQQGLVEFAQELKEDDLNTRMPDPVKRSGWNRQFKSHDKTNKRLMTGAEAAERDASNREQAAAREARQREREPYTLTFGREPILQMVSGALSPPSAPEIMPAASGEALREPLEEEEEEDDPFIAEIGASHAMLGTMLVP